MKTIRISEDVYNKLKSSGLSPNQRIEELLGIVNLNVNGRPRKTTLTEDDINNLIMVGVNRYVQSKAFDVKVKGFVVDIMNGV